MAEFKFSCSHCGQHIQCDEQWGGQQINCPICSGLLVVPHFSPTVAAPAVMRKPAPGPNRSKQIAAWTAGISAFVVAMYFGLKLADKWQVGFNQRAKEEAAHSDGGELTHIAQVYQVLDATDPAKREAAQMKANAEYKKEMARLAEDLKTKPDPTLNLQAIVPTWTLDVEKAAIPDGRINGTSGGASFNVETVKLDRNAASAVLSFTEGVGTTADHELYVFISATADEDLAGRSWKIESNGHGGPQIVRRWTMNPKFAPVQKTFSKGYAMKLEMDQPTRDWQTGRIFLALPDTNQTVLAGEFSIPIPRKPEAMLFRP